MRSKKIDFLILKKKSDTTPGRKDYKKRVLMAVDLFREKLRVICPGLLYDWGKRNDNKEHH